MSMPVTNLDLRGRGDLPDLASVLGHIDTAGYLFGEDDKEHNPAASPDHKAYLQMSNTKDEFPILVRRDGAGNGTKLSASSAALDLALSQSPAPDSQSNGWHGYRHRHDGILFCSRHLARYFALSFADRQVRGMLVSILKRALRYRLTIPILVVRFRQAVNVQMRYLPNHICHAAEGCVVYARRAPRLASGKKV